VPRVEASGSTRLNVWRPANTTHALLRPDHDVAFLTSACRPSVPLLQPHTHQPNTTTATTATTAITTLITIPQRPTPPGYSTVVGRQP